MLVNRHVNNLKPYKLATHRAWELADDPDVLKLDWNESTVPPSPLVLERLQAFIAKGRLNWYPDVNNTVLQAKIARYCQVPVENVQYFASSDSLHEYIIQTFVESDDAVLMVAPTYDNFRATAESLGGVVHFFQMDGDFRIDREALRDRIQALSPRMVYLCNPNNPTGTLTNPGVIEDFLRAFPQTCFLIDEAYFEFAKVTCIPLVLRHPNILVTRTFSKAFGLASFRIGYAVSSEANIQQLSKPRNAKNINQFAQVAAEAALDDLAYMEAHTADVRQAKADFKRRIESIPGAPLEAIVGGGNFGLCRVDPAIAPAFIRFLEANNIFVRSYGHVQLMQNYVRITLGTPAQMERVYEVAARFFQENPANP